MRITVITPLFPPDLGEPAPYVKELISRLTKHEVSLVCYGTLPERVSNITYYPVDMRSFVILRIFNFTKALLRAVKSTDILYVQNGPSVELPVLLASILKRKPMVYIISDQLAWDNRNQNLLYKFLHHRMCKQAKCVLTFTGANSKATTILKPKLKPEILPFTLKSEELERTYEDSWEQHLETLTKYFEHVRN